MVTTLDVWRTGGCHPRGVVFCLTSCSREQQWFASGSFDRTIKLWDLATATSKTEPLLTLHPPEAAGPKASIYALATDPYGSVIASGSPERVIRMWDPRTGKRIAKLVGHTDNIRAILISEDSKYVSDRVQRAAPRTDTMQLLTGSADGASPICHRNSWAESHDSIRQALVIIVSTMSAHIYTPHRVCLVPVLVSSCSRGVLLWRPLWNSVQG